MKKVKINLNRKQIILLFTNIVLIMLYLLLTFFAKGAIKDLYSQQEADRWETKKKPYAQVSAFISPENDMQEEGVSGIRSSLMEKLSNDSYNNAEENARVWIDAYSGECDTLIRKDTNTLSVKAVGIGGEFFQFHPLPLLSGGYISEEDMNHDRILVDEGLAWALFGSNDIVGMQVWLGENIYVIAGVVANEEEKLNKMAYGTGNRIYMSYDELKKKQENLKVTCYEAVLPNPISNYAYYALREAFGIEEIEETVDTKEENPLNFDDVEIIENSNRYETVPLFKKAKTLRLRSIRANSIAYPYWENIARVREDEQIYYLIARIILLIFPVLTLVWWIHALWKHRTWRAKDIIHRLMEKLQDKMEEKREQKLAAKEALMEAVSEGNTEPEEIEEFEETEEAEEFEEYEIEEF